MAGKPTVAIIAQGGMGAACAGRLSDNGVRVVTSLEGRSEASAKRARAAGMTAVSDTEIAACRFRALDRAAERSAAAGTTACAGAHRRQSQAGLCRLQRGLTRHGSGALPKRSRPPGAPFVDAGIIGGPPRPGYGGPIFYYSGAATAGDVERLNEYGLVFRQVDGPAGAASALKMSYGGITKGLTAVGSAMMLAAGRAGVARGAARRAGCEPADPPCLFHPQRAGHVRQGLSLGAGNGGDRPFLGRSCIPGDV